jgi:hypothetical protein
MFDKYVKDIMRIVETDDSVSNLFHGSVLHESANLSNLSIHKIFSPVLYIKESECIFNVGGVYYDRKGQTVSKLSKATIEHLDESFKAACNVLNSGRVSYDELSDGLCISSAVNGSKAIINESGLSINGTATDITTLNENFIAYERYVGNGQFYDDIKTIYESYDIISEVPFVKRVTLNESVKSVDLFKIKNSICLALNEGSISTFYRNVNPLQCKNYINEHMDINASMMFESLMPNQKVIESEIEDSKKAYECYIEELKNKKKTLQGLKESGESEDDEVIDDAIKAIDDELKDVIGDYQEYQKDADEFIGKTKSEEGEDKKENGEDKDKSASDDVKNDVSDPLGTEAEKNGEATVNPENIDDQQGNDQSTDDTVPDLSGNADDYTDGAYAEFDGVLDTPKTDGDFQVVKVSFDKNVKTGKTSGRGTVVVMTPTVNSNGDVKDEITSLTFSLDPATKKPIVNNEHMPLAMYNAIVDAISGSEEIDTIEVEGGEETPAEIPAEAPVDAPVVPEVPSVSSEVPPVNQTPAVADDDLNLPGNSVLGVPEDDFTTSVTADASVNAEELGTHVDAEANKPEEGKEHSASPEEEKEDAELYRDKDESYISVANTQGPIEVGIFEDDVKPLTLSDFAEELDKKELSYKFVKDRETGKDAIVIECETRADVIALRKFFEHIFNTTKETFFEAFPELRCFESFAYKRADRLYESLSDSDEGIEFDLPYSDELADHLKSEGYLTKADVDELTPESDKISVTLEDDDDLNEFFDVLWNYIRDLDESEYRTELIDAVSEISTTTIPVELPLEDGLISELDKKGLVYDFKDGNEEDVFVYISSEDEKEDIFNICDKLGIDLSDEGPLAELDAWTEPLEDDEEVKEDVNEGLKITVEDTENHKKITFDTDDLEDKKDETDKSEEEKDGDSGFGDDTELYNSKEEAQQASDNDNKGGDQGNQNGGQNESEAEDVKKKVKFRFKPKKMNESVATLGVGDTIKYKGRTGRITDKRPDGTFTILVQGETIPCTESDLTPVTLRPDEAEFPHKFDKTTLKNLNAQ